MSSPSLWRSLLSRFKPAVSSDETCFWTVDIHSHLVPGIDDGIQDADQALACLTQLSDWGIKKIITTPHISGDWYATTPEMLRQGQATLQAIIDQHQLPLDVEVAAEYLIDEFFLDLLRKNELVSFGDRRYVLIETGWVWAPNHLDDILTLIQTQGYVPVLAHPERYKYYHNNKKGLLHLREKGCLFQLNWMSLTGRYGPDSQKQARYLAQEAVIDFIGSDLHQPRDLTNMSRLFNPGDLQLLQRQHLLNESLL